MKNKTHNLLVQYCKKCLMPTSRPRVQFDENGVCNACNFVEVKNKINWSKRENQLKEILNEIRSNDGSYDCIVPWSGGKDSSYVAYQLKFKYKFISLSFNKYNFNLITKTKLVCRGKTVTSI